MFGDFFFKKKRSYLNLNFSNKKNNNYIIIIIIK